MTVAESSDSGARLSSLRRLQILDTPAEPAYDDLAQLAAFVCQVPIALVTLLDEDRQWFKSRLGLEVPETPKSIAFCAHAVEQNELLVVEDTHDDERFRRNPLVTGDPGIRFYAGMPVAGPDGSAIGTLCVIDRMPRVLTPEQGATLRALARQVEAHFKIRQQVLDLQQVHAKRLRTVMLLKDRQDKLRAANERLRQMVRTDALTGIPNRRAFDEALPDAWALSGRIGQPVSLLMLDVDLFKQVNDELGHEAGDEVLKLVVRALERNLRSTDQVFRYGGEEFAVLLPGTGSEAAVHVAEQLRRAVWRERIACRDLTVSIGVATDTADPLNAKDCHLVAAADAGLYAAKAAGRNCVIAGSLREAAKGSVGPSEGLRVLAACAEATEV